MYIVEGDNGLYPMYVGNFRQFCVYVWARLLHPVYYRTNPKFETWKGKHLSFSLADSRQKRL